MLLLKVAVFVLTINSSHLVLAELEQKRKGGGTGMEFMGLDKCYRKAKGECQTLESNASCFGVPFPYTMFSPELVNENFTENQLKSDLRRWEGLRNAPKCWQVIQPLLCSYYFPKCSNGSVELPSLEQCRIAQRCRGIIEQATQTSPEFLNCNKPYPDSIFSPTDCKPAIREQTQQFDQTGSCMDPLILVENSFNHYEDFEGCGLKCEDPFYDKEDHKTASDIIKYGGLVSLCFNGWVVASYFIGKRQFSGYPRYPSRSVLWANAFYCITTIAWLLQFIPQTKEDMICRKDGTVKRNEWTDTESIFCALVAIWIYGFIIATLVQLVIFSYVMNLKCRGVGRITNEVDKQEPYFCWAGFLCPASLVTIVCLTVKKFDGNSLYGICFISFYDTLPRILIVICPIGLISCVILFFLVQAAYRLLSHCFDPSGSGVAAEGVQQLKSTAFRFITFSIMAVVLLGAAIMLQINSIRRQPEYDKSLKEWLLCRMNLHDGLECPKPEKPNVMWALGNVFIYFGGAILVSFWGWTKENLAIWRRRFRICGSEEADEPGPAVQKHKLIAKAYGRRDDLLKKGQLNLSMDTKQDPLGLNQLLDPTHIRNNDIEQSQFSQETADDKEINSEWAAAIPRLTNRRGAIVPPHSSNSVSYVSEDSRRPSLDSATSEVAARYLQGSQTGLDYRSRRSRRSRMNRFFWRRRPSNKGSSTSLESNPGSQILPAIINLISKREQMGEPSNFIPNNQQQLLQPQQHTKMVKELAIQTSIEKLYSPPMKGLKQCNLTNSLCVDKATQSSLVSLHEIGTQTKKSHAKKKDKNKNKDRKETEEGAKGSGDVAAIKLLSPNATLP